MQNWTQTLLSQYCDSPTIDGLLNSFNDAVDPAVNLADFYAYIWNVYTAAGQGLDDWGMIVGVSRYLQIPNSPAYLGWKEAYVAGHPTTDPQPFDQAPFYSGVLSTYTFLLQDEDYRQLILTKAAVNISNISIPNINAILRFLFLNPNPRHPNGSVYVIDNLDMSFIYHFTFLPDPVQLAMIETSGVFPRPAGVSVTVTY